MSKRLHIRVGRGKSNQIVIPDDNVAEEHLELFADPEGNIFITDLGSQFGTYINGKRLKGYALLDENDEVVLGSSYRFNWKKYRLTQASEQRSEPNPPKEVRTEKPKTTPKESKSKGASAKMDVPNKQLVIIYGVIVFVIIMMYLIN
ncbi:MAG: FHA domain-containing protein [Flavobacteriia bacterium]|jgi:pSer/pThr/pTyr-binding forkhead associated (FHA) protein|nr:FHA domain-containing protein [Flavobacteriia bacterium]NBV91683.1 FHA domain-containing protein [Flavobacteriia bacterium]NBY39768.1 FHA domain-containing protein [Flavobacteriia bacterium]